MRDECDAHVQQDRKFGQFASEEHNRITLASAALHVPSGRSNSRKRSFMKPLPTPPILQEQQLHVTTLAIRQAPVSAFHRLFWAS